MAKSSCRFSLKIAATIFVIFFIAMIRLMVSLDATEEAASSVRYISTSLNSVVVLQHKINSMCHEVEMLRDQIRELQNAQLNSKLSAAVPAQLELHTRNCLEQRECADKLTRSDAYRGQSYPSERHVPIFTRFDMWHQYYVHSGYGEKVMDKMNGHERVRA